jgi:hypothetical protein
MYFGTPPIIRNGLITYWDAANYLSFTGSISGSFTTLTNVITYLTSSSVVTAISLSYSESYTPIISESITGYITSSSVIGYNPEVTSFDVTTGSTFYIINGTGSNPSLTLVRGTTYTFNITAPDDPFWISTTQETGSATAYTEGISSNGATNGTITFIVSSSAPSPLYYNSEYTSSKSGLIFTTDIPFTGSPIISESYTPITSSSVTYLTSSFTQSNTVEITSSFLVPSSSISSSITLTTASWIDVSGNRNNGAFINNPTFTREGGGAFSFDGASNTVIIPHVSSSYTFTDNITVSYWTKVNSFLTTKALVSKFTGSISGSGFEFVVRNTNKMYFEGRNKNAGVGLFSVSSSQALSTNTWYNVVGIKAGTSVKLYINGQFSNEIIISASGDISNTQPFSIANTSTGGLFYGGTISNLFLYNRVLSDGEILKNYEALRTRYQ